MLFKQLYLQKLVDMVANKCTPLVRLPLHIELLQALVQTVKEGSILWCEPLFKSAVQLG